MSDEKPARPEPGSQESESPLPAPAADGDGESPSRALAEFHAKLLAATPRTHFTYLLLAGNVLMFAAMVVGGANLLNPSNEILIAWGADYGPRTLSGEPWRLLASMFIHIGIIHLLCNMWALYQLGPFVERLLGNAAFIALYLLAGLAGSLASLAWNPAIVSAGASGALFGVFGALLVALIRLRRDIPAKALGRLWNSVAICVGLNVFLGFRNPHIDNAAHIGGLLAGFLAALVLIRPPELLAVRGAWRRGALVGLVGAAALAGAAMLLPRDVGDYQAALRECAREEKRAIEVFNDGVNQVKAGTMTEEQWAERIEKEALPCWKSIATTMRGLRSLPRRTREQADELAAYAEASGEWMSLHAQALRTKDPELMAKAAAKRAQARRMIKDGE